MTSLKSTSSRSNSDSSLSSLSSLGSASSVPYSANSCAIAETDTRDCASLSPEMIKCCDVLKNMSIASSNRNASPFPNLSLRPSLQLSTNTTSSATFHQFPALPIGIRRMIWRLAFLETQPPRLIEVRAQIEDNLFWDVDCENILFPEPTGSRVVRWMEVNPRGPCAIEMVCLESRQTVNETWNICFNNMNAKDIGMIEVSLDDVGKEEARYVRREIVEKRLGWGFKKGIRFLRDRDVVYLRTKDNGTMRALQDARASMLGLQDVRKVAVDMFWRRHYLLEKQLFGGWYGEDKESMSGEQDGICEIMHVREEPLLKGVEELTIFMGNEIEDSKIHSMMEELEENEMLGCENLNVEFIREKELAASGVLGRQERMIPQCCLK